MIKYIDVFNVQYLINIVNNPNWKNYLIVNSKLKSVEDIIKRSPTLKKNAKSLMNNFYTTSDKKNSDYKVTKTNSGINSYMNKTSMLSDILTTHHTTIATTDENNVTARKLNNPKFKINPDYVKQINNISNDKTINHLLNVIVNLKDFLFVYIEILSDSLRLSSVFNFLGASK